MARKREFEIEYALADIKAVFWQHGYEGATMALIEEATGLKKQSLYRVFGDKRAMYLAALRNYDSLEINGAISILQKEGKPSKRIDNLLRAIIQSSVTNGDRRGCFLCNASVDQAPLDTASSDLVKQLIKRFKTALEKCLASALPYADNSKATRETASAILAGYFGIRVMIKAGLPEKSLNEARKTLISQLIKTN